MQFIKARRADDLRRDRDEHGRVAAGRGAAGKRMSLPNSKI